jgi:hypothetical protein
LFFFHCVYHVTKFNRSLRENIEENVNLIVHLLKSAPNLSENAGLTDSNNQIQNVEDVWSSDSSDQIQNVEDVWSSDSSDQFQDVEDTGLEQLIALEKLIDSKYVIGC